MSKWVMRVRAAAVIFLAITATGRAAADRLAYQTLVGAGLHAIIVTDSKGEHPVEFRHPGGVDTITPALSPDGSQLAYAATAGGHYKIFSLALARNGSPAGKPLQLTSGDSDDEQPAWSPNGRRIAYVSQLGQSRTLWMMPAERGPLSEFAKLASALAGPLSEFAKLAADLHSTAPSWSPDGLSVAFSREGRLWIKHVDLSDIDELHADGVYPSWSPDGAQIAFFARKPEPALTLISPTTGATRALLTGVEGFGETAWSPDGKSIAFKADKVGGVNGNLWVVPVEGGEAKPLRVRGVADAHFDWSWDPATALVAVKPSAASQITKGPYLLMATETGMTVMWETDFPSDSVVDYGADAGYGETVTDAKPVTIHQLRLAGLTPDTTYHYRVRSAGLTSEDSTLHTAVPPGAPFRFTVYGDNRSGRVNHRIIAERMLAEKPNLVLSVGDIVMDGIIDEQWGVQFFKPAANLLRQVPMYVAIGNHERNSYWFYDLFAYPRPGDYYSFHYGSAHFAMVDTLQPYERGSAQYEWLQADLASDAAQKADWRFVFTHIPPYSESTGGGGYPSVQAALVPLMERYGVDILFAGHEHDYERGFRNGVYYIVTGGGGATLDTYASGLDMIQVFQSLHHYCRVDINGSTLTMNVISITGEPVDSLVIGKRPRPRA